MSVMSAVFFTSTTVVAAVVAAAAVLIVITAACHRRHAAATDLRLCRGCGVPHAPGGRFCRRCGRAAVA